MVHIKIFFQDSLILILFPLIAIVSIPKLSVVKFCIEALTYGS